MNDITYIPWNVWHGCHKKSEGCENCYMFEQDKVYDKHSDEVYLVKSNYNLPIRRDKKGYYKIPSRSCIGVCLTSDFFIEEADKWRMGVWHIIKKRRDCLFIIITKRVERILECLPSDWGEGYSNVMISATTENNKRAAERLPILMDLPVRYKGITVAPILEKVILEPYLMTKQFLRVAVGGESNISMARKSNFDWILSLYNECQKYEVDFTYYQTGSLLEKDGKLFKIPLNKGKDQAKKANLNLSYKCNSIVLESNTFEMQEQLSLI